MPGTDSPAGVLTALVTPFRGGKIDWPTLDRLVDRQIAAGVDWLVPLGTTGEAPTLTEAERRQVLERIIERTAGRRPVLAGTGTYCTAESTARTRIAAETGAKAAMLVTPYYNRPTQEGMYRHFASVASSVDIPIVLYNVPGRCGVRLENETIARLARDLPNIVAVKDATQCVENVTALASECEITILCGDDALTYPFMCLGAKGVISVLANLSPGLLKSLVAASKEGDFMTAQPSHRKVFDLATGLSRLGPNPVPIKTAMAVAGLIEEEFRLPLCPMNSESRATIVNLLQRHELAQRTTR